MKLNPYDQVPLRVLRDVLRDDRVYLSGTQLTALHLAAILTRAIEEASSASASDGRSLLSEPEPKVADSQPLDPEAEWPEGDLVRAIQSHLGAMADASCLRCVDLLKNAACAITLLRKSEPTSDEMERALADNASGDDTPEAGGDSLAARLRALGEVREALTDAADALEGAKERERQAAKDERAACIAELRRSEQAERNIGRFHGAEGFHGAANTLSNSGLAWDRVRAEKGE